MTRDEFDALKPGDKIRNDVGQVAEIIVSGPSGHAYRWSEFGPAFHLFGAGNMWRSFSVVVPAGDDA